MNDTERAYMLFARSSHEVTVEILKGDVPLIRYKVPWSTRVQGSYLSHHNNSVKKSGLRKGTATNPIASAFDPWKGFNKSTPGVWTRDKLFMCVPGMEVAPTKKVQKA